MNTTLHRQLKQLASDRWAQRGVRLLLRATMLALLLLAGAAALQLFSAYTPNWALVNAAALACVGVGAGLVLRRPASPPEVARDLDRRFQLHEQLGTALELATPTEGVAVHLHEQSRTTMQRLHAQVAVQQVTPWREITTTLVLLLLVLGLLFISGRTSQAQVPPEALRPPEADTVPPSDPPIPDVPPPPPPAEGMPDPGASQLVLTDPTDLAVAAALAEALREQSVTRPAAEALERGQAGDAAQQLRDLADQAAGLTPQTRDDLAQALRDAASQIEPLDNALANQVRGAAEQLNTTGYDPADAFTDLAQAIEQWAQERSQSQEQPAAPADSSGGAGAGSAPIPGEQREHVRERLGVEGVPLELESSGPGSVPTDGNPLGAPQDSAGGSGGSFTRGSQSGEAGTMRGDPLRIPLDLRDVVQDYFSP
ncbi:MAG: hypothetical protein EI684_16565 [Candidatus Viridilinea halotolerans]|uniref:Uncharacterized protein n=1 Tax=Candidatus Viridilinea halotolerans TaxID=2491704 RepID=A0A426TUU5_9CHLR|nr:MAG: hypothetical protein EI684_16565 [Candidatus Viridilinea halotolerans]